MAVKPSSHRLINIHVSAQGVSNKKFFSKTDPLCVMFTQAKHGWHEYGRTEVCWDILDPVWVRPFTFRVVPNKPELLRFEVYDIVEQFYDLKEQKLLGYAELDLAVLLHSPKHMLTLEIISVKTGEARGTLTVSFFDLHPSHGSLFFKMSCSGIKSSARVIRKANPFFVISRFSEHAEQYVAVYKSAVRSRTHVADWMNIELFKQFVCGGDLSTGIMVSVYDYRRRDTDNYIGHFTTTMRELVENRVSEFDIIDEDRKKFAGQFSIELLSDCESPRLFDYRLLGVQLSAMITIDFSASSVGLVYNNLGQHNNTGVFSYRYAVNDVCDLLMPLTMGQPYSAYAFADFHDGEHVKSLVKRKTSDVITNAGALLIFYEQMKRNCKFPKRASLAPVIEKARDDARRKWEDERTITVLCIITNGIFTDLQRAIDVLVESETEPLVVLLVVMGGTRRELERAFKHKKGHITDSQGRTTKRRVLKMVTYLQDKVYPDPRLPKKLMPSAKAMARNWLEITNFYESSHSEA